MAEVETSREDAVLTVTLNRPDVLNAFNTEMHRGLAAALKDSGGSYFVTRILGPARAFEWLASGRKLTAAEAHAWGLVSEVVDEEALSGRVAELAAQLAALPTRGIGMTKRLVDHALEASLEQ